MHAFRWLTAREVKLPIVIAEDDAESRAFRQRADSIMQARREAEARPIPINTAGSSDLQRIDGIGPVLAGRIISYREQHGPFKNMDDLLKVSGIGPKRLAAIRERCCIGSPDSSGGKQSFP